MTLSTPLPGRTRRETFTTEAQAKALAGPLANSKRDALEYWHEKVPGFGIRVHRTTERGTVRRVWIARLSKKSDKGGSKPVLGTLGEIDFEAVKIAALSMRQDRRMEKEQGITVAPSLRDGYASLVKSRSAKWSRVTRRDYDKRLKVIADWGSTRLDALSPKDRTEKYHAIAKKNGLAQAKGVLRVASSVYNHLIATHDKLVNPISRISREIKLYAKDKATTAPVPAADLPLMWTHLHVAGGVYRDWILFVLFTGFRSAIAERAAWERLDLKARTYLLRGDDDGNKSGEDILFPLPDWLCENVLEHRAVARAPANPWIFPSTIRRMAPVTTIAPFYRVFEKKTGVRVRPHMLRATFATIADAKLGKTLILSALLTHATGRKSPVGEELKHDLTVTAGYAKKTTTELRDAINVIAQGILQFAAATDMLRASQRP